MKKHGYIKYPDITVQLENKPPTKQIGRILYGWNRGKLIFTPTCIMFEDISGIVHVVQKQLFHKSQTEK